MLKAPDVSTVIAFRWDVLGPGHADRRQPRHSVEMSSGNALGAERHSPRRTLPAQSQTMVELNALAARYVGPIIDSRHSLGDANAP